MGGDGNAPISEGAQYNEEMTALMGVGGKIWNLAEEHERGRILALLERFWDTGGEELSGLLVTMPL
jgi:hypothetical protein